MSYTLLVTEKPNAAKRIAHALAEEGVQKLSRKGAPYYRIRRGGRDIVVVSAVGHLFVLDEVDKGAKWRYPVFSVEWKPTYTERGSSWSKKYFDNVSELAAGASDFISSCDFDIEGSVIAYNVLRFICKTQHAKRMKFSTLTTPDLVKAYDKASPKLDFPQIEAGLARHYLDWYFGVNLSRALTLSLEHVGGYWILSTGRVQGPTLELLEKREDEISRFKSVPFWEIELHGNVDGKDITAQHVKGKFWKHEQAKGVVHRCEGKPGRVSSVKRTQQSHLPPVPFDLTTLQRESYGLFGYSPKMTLDIAQSLYEHALISYPRTSSQQLPPAIGYKSIITKLSGQPWFSGLCKKLLARGTLKPMQGSKTDPAHPAIFPTGTKPKKLNTYQKKLYELIVHRFMAAFADPATRELVRVGVDVNGEQFAAHGITTLGPGWMEFYKPFLRMKDVVLPDIREGDAVKVKKIEVLEKETQPPSRFTQASILKEMEDLGLGTKATRAHILHTLYERGYIRERSIIVTDLGKAVIKALEKYCPEIISVELTRSFEQDMEDIESGKKDREQIVKGAERELRGILAKFKEHEHHIGSEIKEAVKEYEHEQHDVGKCPKCGKGDLMIIHSHKTGKRFVGCSHYPKCNNSFPLPQHGFINVTTRKCFCGLGLIMVRTKGKRPWKFCVEHGFNYYKKKEKAEKKEKAAKPKRDKK
ncbi:MAG: DNA topoisomerase I [Candidatus Aenigmarchaeota archaeon]|nr:DNA topoisomerase I [Candidatus Aenigmarchaeota archaeon]